MLPLDPSERSTLCRAVLAELVEIRPDGIVYVPWAAVADRLDEALGIGQWCLVPDGKPQLQDSFVCWGFSLIVRGRFAAYAIGEHPDPGNRRMSLANRAESAKSDALVKCSKALGIFRELWNPGWREDWMQEYAVRVWAKTYENGRFSWLWRRKDRPHAFFAEGRQGRESESEYTKPRRMEDDARDHINAIAREN